MVKKGDGRSKPLFTLHNIKICCSVSQVFIGKNMLTSDDGISG